MKLFLAFALIASTMFLLSGTASAQTAPTVFANSGHCNRSIVEDDDLFCQLVYELPQSISDGVSDAWCAELFDEDGCADTPANPTDPTSLPQGKASIALYDNCTTDCLTADLLGLSRAPRIWHGLGGIYIEEAGSITFGDADINICIESVTGAFSTKEQSCIIPKWSTADNDTASQRDDLATNFVTNVTTLQTERNQAFNTYVTTGKITTQGSVFAKEALELATTITPGAFVASISGINDIIPTPSIDQLNIDIQATATAITGAYETIGGLISPTGQREIGGLVLFGGLGLLSFLMVFRITREFIWPSIAFGAWGLFGVVAGGIDSEVIFIYVFMIALPAIVFMYRRLGYTS